MGVATFYQDGLSIDYTPASDVSEGDIVVQGSLVGVAKKDIDADDKGSLAVAGVFKIQKEEVAFSAGDDVYFDTDSELAFSGGGTYVGKCIEDAAASDATVKTLLVQQEADVSGTATGTGTGAA